MTQRTLASWPYADQANPYVLRLNGALAARGVAVRSARYLAEHCLRPRGARWLHVHWPEWMTHDDARLRARAGAAWQATLFAAARAQGVRLAWTAHNLFGHDERHGDLAEAARRTLLARCDVVFGHFASAEADVRALGFRGRFALTPHPHYDRDYGRPFANPRERAAWRRAQGVADDEVLLVSAGAMEPYKNLVATAHALRALAPSRVRWIVAGRAAHDATLGALRLACEGAPWISLRPGFVPRDELARLVSAADASLLAYSEFYTSGAAVLSLTLETPVIGAPAHHLASYLGEDFFVPLSRVDVASLGPAIERVRALDAGVRAAARARALAETWEHAASVVDTTLFGAPNV